jgi:hypothetical protein
VAADWLLEVIPWMSTNQSFSAEALKPLLVDAVFFALVDDDDDLMLVLVRGISWIQTNE